MMADSGRLGRVVGIDAEGAFRPMSARRLLVLGGIGLILVGMLFGDLFAVFALHQNAAKVERVYRRRHTRRWRGMRGRSF